MGEQAVARSVNPDAETAQSPEGQVMVMTPEPQIVDVFYRVERAGQLRLSDGGGPFGFDVTIALIIDYLVGAYDCDAIIETGCYLGDTTVYLARQFSALPVYSCDIDPDTVTFTRRRLDGCPNAVVTAQDSPALVSSAGSTHERPLFYLDAHWGPDWPLPKELAAIGAGVVVIDDFDIGHPRFSFDEYGGVRCSPDLLTRLPEPPQVYFTNDPAADYPLPCLQTGRRSGIGVLVRELSSQPLYACPYLAAHDLNAEHGHRVVQRA